MTDSENTYRDNKWIISYQHEIYIWERQVKDLLDSAKKYGGFRCKVEEGLPQYIESMSDCWDEHIYPTPITKEFSSSWVIPTSKVSIGLWGFLCMLWLFGLLRFRVLHCKIDM